MTSLQREVREEVLNLMEAEGVTQKELARRLGVTHSLVSQWLHSKHNWTLSTLERIGEALGYTFVVSGWQIDEVPLTYFAEGE